MKKLIRALLLSLFAGSILSLPARADFNPANDAAELEVLITPSIDRGILIDTANVSMDLGVLDMNASTQTVRPASVTVLGNVTNTELNLSAEITGGWLFDDDVATAETDKLAAWAVFTSTNVLSAPAKSGSRFDDAQDALNSGADIFPATRVGLAGGNNGLDDRFEDGVTGMDSLNPGTRRNLWLYFRTPQFTSTANEQKIRINLTVTPGP